MQWPIDTDTWQWSDDPAVLEEFNVTRDMLFELQMPGDVAGYVTPDGRRGDRHPGGPAGGRHGERQGGRGARVRALDEQTALVSLGTYIASMVHGRENRKTPAEFWTNFACVPNKYLYESHGMRRGMWTLTWFLDLLGEEFADAAASAGISREQYLEREAEESRRAATA